MPQLLRAALHPRVRPVLLVAAGALLATAACCLCSKPARLVVQPIFVPAPQVTVAPAPVVLPPAAPAPPPPVEAPAPTDPPANLRSPFPTLDALCLAQPKGYGLPETCQWDDGFPAISGDGTLIATKDTGERSQSDHDGLAIKLIDTATSRVVRNIVIFTYEESFKLHPYEDAQDISALLTTITRRVAAAQRTLDGKRFRSLHFLGASHGHSNDTSSSTRGTEPIYAELLGTEARIIDSNAHQVLWRGSFYGSSADRPKSEDCGGWGAWSTELWWDPTSRYILGAQTYRTGGCMCPDVPVDTVQRMR